MDSIRGSDFALAACQASLFTPDEEISAMKLIKGLLSRWIERFNEEPIVIPHEGLPREVPRVILRSTGEVWRCEIASARINIFWKKNSPDTPAPSLAQFYGDASELLSEYRSFLGARVGRMAAVVTRYARHSDPGLFLASHFCNDRWLSAPFNRPESFELHAHKRFTFSERFMVNSWVRNKTGQLSFGDETVPIVLIEQDLNTLNEEITTRDFSSAEMKDFFTAVPAELDTILGLYFPAGAA